MTRDLSMRPFPSDLNNSIPLAFSSHGSSPSEPDKQLQKYPGHKKFLHVDSCLAADSFQQVLSLVDQDAFLGRLFHVDGRLNMKRLTGLR